MQAILVVCAAAEAALDPWLCPAAWGAAVQTAPTLERLRDCLAALEAAVAPGRLASDYLRRPACVRGAWLPTRDTPLLFPRSEATARAQPRASCSLDHASAPLPETWLG